MEQKVNIIKKVEQGPGKADVHWEYKLSKTTLVGILTAEDNLSKFYVTTEANTLLTKIKTVRKPKLIELPEQLRELGWSEYKCSVS